MRKLVYCIAATADGFIAAPDGSYDAFLLEGPHIAELIADYPETFPTHLRNPLGLTGPNRRSDSVLMGRATWEVGVPAAGIPLFGRAVKPKRMTLTERRIYDNGCLRLHYALR
jgi:hypothetical protein